MDFFYKEYRIVLAPFKSACIHLLLAGTQVLEKPDNSGYGDSVVYNKVNLNNKYISLNLEGKSIVMNSYYEEPSKAVI